MSLNAAKNFIQKPEGFPGDAFWFFLLYSLTQNVKKFNLTEDNSRAFAQALYRGPKHFNFLLKRRFEFVMIITTNRAKT